ncbi:MAG: ATP-binding protein, partial [Candidatus Omnitrophota bacterium]
IEVQSIDRLSKIIPRYLMRLYARMDNKISQISLFLKEKGTSQYVLKSSVGESKLADNIVISANSILVKWFTVIRDVMVDKGTLKAKEVEVLVYEDLDFWLNNSAAMRIPLKGAANIFRELRKIMKSLNANVILPSVYQKELLGFLILGEKIPEPYTISDIDTFSILANDSAMAFKAAQLFEELKTSQARLIQSEKLNLLGQLASSMAHEINNPLAIISGNVQLLLMDENDNKKKKVLKKINDQTERGYQIINRLLNFSRLSKEDIKDIEVHELIDDTLELINHKILHGNIQLDKEYDCKEHIKGNPTQIQEVLLNLFVNAVQAMPEGGRLKISTKDLRDNVEIVVQDTGKGIPEKDVDNVFDPFYTQGKEEGTGLGLFVASQIMGLHNGTIDVKSKVGEGTAFVLRFKREQKKT